VFLGDAGAETVANGVEKSVRMTLGCIYEMSGAFIEQVEDGIMGLGMSDETFVPSLVTAGQLSHKALSLAFIIHPFIILHSSSFSSLTFPFASPPPTP